MSVTVASGRSVEVGRAEARMEGLGVRFDFDRRARVLTPMLTRLRRVRATTWGLRGVDLHLEPGSGVALIGPTGSGKTTLLRTLAGAIPPDEGRIDVRGRIGSLLATGAGLAIALTGRENAELLGVLAGLSLAETRARMEHVKELSELEDSFERPAHTYSQGMRARLGFAVIQVITPDLLLLDEVFEALDHDFRGRVERFGRELRERGGVVVAAGHDHAALEHLCRDAVWLDHGRIRASGPFAEVTATYRSA